MEKLRLFLERQIFGVCTRLGEIIGMSSSSIRLFFIYASFLTLGSPVVLYLSLAFIRNIRKHFRKFNNPFNWDL